MIELASILQKETALSIVKNPRKANALNNKEEGGGGKASNPQSKLKG